MKAIIEQLRTLNEIDVRIGIDNGHRSELLPGFVPFEDVGRWID